MWCLQPGPVGGFAALGAVLRRVVGVSWLYWCNSPRGRRCRGYGWRLAVGPGSQAPGAPCPAAAHAPQPPGAPPMPPGPAWPPALDLPRDVGRPPRPSQAPRAARPAQLSAAFQAFVRNGSQPLHLGVLICQRPLDVRARHAQAFSNKCSARHNLTVCHAVMHRLVTTLSTVLTGVWGLRARVLWWRRVSDKPTCLCASEGTFVRGSTSARMAGVILTARSVHRVFPLAVPRSVAHNI